MKKQIRRIALHKETLQYLEATGGALGSAGTECRSVCGTCPTECYYTVLCC